jgi:hypothetical protein
LLQTQLIEQQIFFEKKLARETVLALELNFSFIDNNNNNHNNNNNNKNNNISSSNSNNNDDDEKENFLINLSNEIEKLKIEITSIEMQYKNMLKNVKIVNEESQKLRNKNDVIIQQIKKHVYLFIYL